MYEIVIKNKDKKIIFIGNTYSIIENIRYYKAESDDEFGITFNTKHVKYFDIGNIIEFFNKPVNEFSYFRRIILRTDGNNIVAKDASGAYNESVVLNRFKKDKIKFRLNKLNKI